MPNLVPRNQSIATTGSGSARLLGALDRRTARSLSTIEHQTLTRMARVRGEAMVQVEKSHEIDRLVREAMSGQAMLTRWSQTLAQGDPFIVDDLRFFADLAKMAKGEIIADTASSFCQEGR